MIGRWVVTATRRQPDVTADSRSEPVECRYAPLECRLRGTSGKARSSFARSSD
jgi:hypothetical protein